MKWIITISMRENVLMFNWAWISGETGENKLLDTLTEGSKWHFNKLSTD